MSAASLKEKAMFAVSVCLVIASVAYVQSNWKKIPLIGDYLPGA